MEAILDITAFSGFTIRLALAIVLGFIVGFERQWTKHQAGILTNVIVCVGAYAYTAFSCMALGNDNDTTRVAAQVVSGIASLVQVLLFVTAQKSAVFQLLQLFGQLRLSAFCVRLIIFIMQ